MSMKLLNAQRWQRVVGWDPIYHTKYGYAKYHWVNNPKIHILCDILVLDLTGLLQLFQVMPWNGECELARTPRGQILLSKRIIFVGAVTQSTYTTHVSCHILLEVTVPAEQSLHLIPGLFGFDWVATECKLSLIMSCNVLESSGLATPYWQGSNPVPTEFHLLSN